MNGTGAALGLLAGTGIVMAVAATPVLRRRRLLDSRLAPYLLDAPQPSRLLASDRTFTPFPTAERIVRPVLGDAVRALDRLLGGSGPVRRRLEQAGRGMSLEEFRAEQVVWGTVGATVGLALGLLIGVRRGVTAAVPVLALTFAGVIAGVLTRDRWLSREVRERESRILAELPTVAELLVLAVTAGEGLVGAIDRVSRISGGELAGELRRALAESRSGVALTTALDALAARTSISALARFVDGMVIAVERGTPLADVLRAQAIDVREAGRRALLESGGRKEIAMMIPVVFLILPVTVLFALFPGYYGLTFSTP
ncbi:MAG: type II secretion system F family protein [Actinomycetes bacterium]